MNVRIVIELTPPEPETAEGKMAAISRVAEILNGYGLEYDTDYTTLYGTDWEANSLQLTSPKAVQTVAALTLLGQWDTSWFDPKEWGIEK